MKPRIVIEIYLDKRKEWRWRARHRNGRILAESGEGYKTRAGLWRGIDAVAVGFPAAEVKYP